MDLRNILCVFLLLLAAHANMLRNYAILRNLRDRPRRRWWVRPVNRVRNAQGFYNNLVQELLTEDHEEFFSLFRLWPEQFQLLVDLVRPHLRKTSIRTPLPTELRVAVTLLFLAQGGTSKLQHAEFRIGSSTVNAVIHETCRAFWKALHPTVLKFPSKADWKGIAEGFKLTWQFPNCIGAIDGRHMRIQAPPNSGSQYHNYKNFFSMVLLATCDHQYRFTWIDIGQYGSISDGGVWAATDFPSDLKDGTIDLPDPCPLPGDDQPVPHFFVGDEAFPLTEHMMRPYSRKVLSDDGRIFNYRFSRARRTIENTFGILTARWQILNKPLRMSARNCENVFKALVVLHNFIMIGEASVDPNVRRYAPTALIDVETEDGQIRQGEWRQQVAPYFKNLGRVGGNRSNCVAYGSRDYLREYLCSDLGTEQAPWQYQYAFGRQYDVHL